MRQRRWREPAPVEGCGKTAISSSTDGFCLISSLELSTYQHRCHFESRFYMDELRWLTSGMKDPLKFNLWAFFSPMYQKKEALQNNLEQVWGLQSCKSNSSAWALKDRLSLPMDLEVSRKSKPTKLASHPPNVTLSLKETLWWLWMLPWEGPWALPFSQMKPPAFLNESGICTLRGH